MNWIKIFTVVVLIGGFAFGASYLTEIDKSHIRVDYSKIRGEWGNETLFPKWIPQDVAYLQSARGELRDLVGFMGKDEVALFITAQEVRTANRDKWNSQFVKKEFAEKAKSDKIEAGFTDDDMGARRLSWFTKDRFVRVSSYFLSDHEMIKIAESME